MRAEAGAKAEVQHGRLMAAALTGASERPIALKPSRLPSTNAKSYRPLRSCVALTSSPCWLRAGQHDNFSVPISQPSGRIT